MVMPGKNIIITNLLFQQTAIAYFLLQWTQHSYLVRMKDCFLDQLQKFQAEKRKLKDEQPLTLTSLCFLTQAFKLYDSGFFSLFDWKDQKLATLSPLYIHTYLHSGISSLTLKKTSWKLLCWTTVQPPGEDLPKGQTEETQELPLSEPVVTTGENPLGLTGPRFHKEKVIKHRGQWIYILARGKSCGFSRNGE